MVIYFGVESIRFFLYSKVHDILLEHAKKYLMHLKLSKTFIKHCNACFLTLNGFINRFQKFQKLYIF
jgi:hypothetical protein